MAEFFDSRSAEGMIRYMPDGFEVEKSQEELSGVTAFQSEWSFLVHKNLLMCLTKKVKNRILASNCL